MSRKLSYEQLEYENEWLRNEIKRVNLRERKEKEKMRKERDKAKNILKNVFEILEQKGGFKVMPDEEYSHAASRWVKEVNEKIRAEQKKDFRKLYYKEKAERKRLESKVKTGR